MIFGIKFEHKGRFAELEYGERNFTVSLLSDNGHICHAATFPVQPHEALTDAITRYLWPKLDWSTHNPPEEALVIGRLLQFLDTPL